MSYGRSRRLLVEEVNQLSVREIVRRSHLEPLWFPTDLWQADIGRAVVTMEAVRHYLCGTRSPVLRWYVRCPECGQRRTSLYEVGERLSCRGCLRLSYQSQTREWSVPLHDRIKVRTDQLAQRRGPKGRRWRSVRPG